MNRLFIIILFLYSTFSLFSQKENTKFYKSLFPDGKKYERVKLTDSERYDVETNLFNYQIALLKNQPQLAFEYLDNSLKIDSTCAVCMFKLTQLAFENSPEHGIKPLFNSIAYDPENFTYLSYFINYLYYHDKLDYFLEVLEYAAHIDFENTYFKENLLQTYLQLKDYQDALNTIELIEDTHGSNSSTISTKADLYSKLGKKKQAKKLLEKQIKKEPANSDLYSTLSNLYYFDFKNLKKAEQYSLQALEIDNQNPQAQFLMFSISTDNKNIDSQIFYLKEIISNPQFSFKKKVVFIPFLAPSTDVLLSLDETFEFLINLIKLDESNTIIIQEYIEVNNKNSKIKTDDFIRLISSSLNYTDDVDLWLTLLTLTNDLTDIDSTYINTAFELHPDNGAINYIIGLHYYLNEDLDNSFKHFLISVDNQEDFNSDFQISIAYSLLAEIYIKENNYEEAFNSFDKALLLDNENITVLNNYAYYLSLKKKNLERAESMISTVIKKDPHNPVFLDTYAWVMFAKGLYSDALFIFEQIDVDSQDKSIYYEHYGDILFFNDNTDKAVYYWNKALEIFDGEDSDDDTILKKKIEHRKYFEPNED